MMMEQGNAAAPKEKETAILFIDILAFASLMEHLGDLQAHSVIRQFFDRALRYAKVHKGQIIKVIGDGIFAIFDKATEAVEYALEIQQSLSSDPISAEGYNLHIRISIHFDKVHVSDTEYGLEAFGNGVNFAARILSYGIPGSVMLSDSAYQQLPRELAARFSIQQQFSLKGFKKIATVWSLSVTPEDSK